MIEVVVVGEGQTEEMFVKNLLAPALAECGVFVQPRLIATSTRSKGGALARPRVLRFLRNTLRERHDTYVTTLFDLYGLSSDFPGRGAVGSGDPLDRVAAIEAEFHRVVVEEAQCRSERFVPHIQPYEFEALLFSDVRRFAEAESMWAPFVGQLEASRQFVESPEHINDGYDSHPSARLRKLLRPGFHKLRHGLAVAQRIGLDRIRAECRHFDSWMKRLESLLPLAAQQ